MFSLKDVKRKKKGNVTPQKGGVPESKENEEEQEKGLGTEKEKDIEKRGKKKDEWVTTLVEHASIPRVLILDKFASAEQKYLQDLSILYQVSSFQC